MGRYVDAVPSNLEVPVVVLQFLAGFSALSVQFWMGLTAARLPGGRFRHPLRIRLCTTSSLDGSAAKKKYIYIYTRKKTQQ